MSILVSEEQSEAYLASIIDFAIEQAASLGCKPEELELTISPSGMKAIFRHEFAKSAGRFYSPNCLRCDELEGHENHT